MKNQLLFASLLLAGVASAGADDLIAAQPITLSPLVGLEQSDFYVSAGRDGDDRLLFTGAITPAGARLYQTRSLFSTKLDHTDARSGVQTIYDTVGSANPLVRLGSYVVPIGWPFEYFLQSYDPNFPLRQQVVFHVPGKGLYLSTAAWVPVLLRTETLNARMTGAALRFPGNTAFDTDHTQQFRVIFGAKDPRKGYEPCISAGAARLTSVLTDLQPGLPGSNPAQFISFNNEVYFVADNPANGGLRDIFRTTVSTLKATPVYAAVAVTSLASAPSLLTSTNAGLFYNLTDATTKATTLYQSPDAVSFSPVLLDDGTPLAGVSQVISSIDPSSDLVGLVAYDSTLKTNRFAMYSNSTHQVTYPEVLGSDTVITTAPTHVISTGDYFYFGAMQNGVGSCFARVLIYDFGVDYVDAEYTGNPLSNVKEIVDVPDAQFGGVVYVTGDAALDGGDLQTGLLFSIDTNSQSPVAQPVRTNSGAPVVGAHNLRAVHNGTISRLYFSAPVSTTLNSEYAYPAKDYGTKPWVVSQP